MRVRRIVASVAAVVMGTGGVSLASAPGASAVSAPVGAPTAVVAGDVAPRAKVPVTVTVTNGGRLVEVRVDWNDKLADRPGRDRFSVRLITLGERWYPVYEGKVRPDGQPLTQPLTAPQAKAFRKARNAGIARVVVTQQFAREGSNDVYERNYVTVIRVPRGDTNSSVDDVGPLRNCSDVTLRKQADLRNCDLAEVYLAEADLRGANLRGAILRDADLTGAILRGANLRGANLRGAVLDGADLSGADLTGASLTGATCFSTTWVDGQNVPYACPSS